MQPDYMEKARECARLAELMIDPERRLQMLSLAQQWRQLAQLNGLAGPDPGPSLTLIGRRRPHDDDNS
jgi:hypothetical protein